MVESNSPLRDLDSAERAATRELCAESRACTYGLLHRHRDVSRAWKSSIASVKGSAIVTTFSARGTRNAEAVAIFE